MARLKPEIRELVEWAEANGWSLDGKLDGQGHWILRHRSGEQVRVPATPSEYRGLANARAVIRRLAGLPSESGPAARYRHEKRRDRFDMDAAVRERDERLAREESADVLFGQYRQFMDQLQQCNPRQEPRRARELAIRVTRVASLLESLGYDVEADD